MITHIITATLAASIAASAAWTWQGAKITTLELSHANERITLQAAARHAIDRQVTSVSQAQSVATTRLADLAADRERLGTHLERLRAQSADTLRAAGQSLDACLADATAKSELLEHCAGRLVSVSAAADAHVIDVRALIEAWPK